MMCYGQLVDVCNSSITCLCTISYSFCPFLSLHHSLHPSYSHPHSFCLSLSLSAYALTLGTDGTTMFEDVGHSSEARAAMKEFLVGSVKVSKQWVGR
jgi:hypothetical protein